LSGNSSCLTIQLEVQAGCKRKHQVFRSLECRTPRDFTYWEDIVPPRLDLFCVVFLMLVGAFGNVQLAHGQTVHSGSEAGVEVANLREQLTFGLRARLPSEHAFIDLVVERVRMGKLPVEVVMGTFQWARRKRPYPFPYFESALRLRAARKGISL
jgi:hypothetical protein